MNKIFTVTLNPAVDRELTVPEILFDKVLRATDWQVDFGGKGFNVSRMLKSLGTDSTALGFAGGKSGERLQEGLESLGIETDFIRIAGETRTNVSIVAGDGAHHIKANEPGPTVSAEEQQALLAQVRRACQPGDWWVLAGSLPPGVPVDFYRQLIELIQQAGARVVLDTSGEALARGCQAGPYLIKPNAMELAKLTGMPTADTEQILRAVRFQQVQGVLNMLVSNGKAGAILAAGDEAWLVTGPTIPERNPIGAGDSMVGGMVWGLTQGLSMAESARWGVACGAAAASLSGTAVGSKAQVTALFSETTVQPLYFEL